MFCPMFREINDQTCVKNKTCTVHCGLLFGSDRQASQDEDF